MRKRFTLFFSLFFICTVLVFSQEPLIHQKRVYRGEGNKLFINKELPVFIRIATSSDDKAESWLLHSEESKKYSNPMYLDAEGWNTLRSPSAVDTVTKKTVTPMQDIIFELYADGIAPATVHKFTGTQTFTSKGLKYFGKELSIEMNARDETSGLDKIYCSINKRPWSAYEKPLILKEEGEYELNYYSVDNVGNVEKIKTETFIIDFTPPVTNHRVDGINKNNVISRNASIVLVSEDKLSGLGKIFYSIDKGDYIVYTKPIPVSLLKDGEAQLNYYSIDNVGNKEEVKSIGTFSSGQAGSSDGSGVEFDFYIDRKPPVIDFKIDGDQFANTNILYISERSHVRLDATDDKSGVQAVYYSYNSFLTKEEYKEPFKLALKGPIKFSYNGTDWVDNVSQVMNRQLFLDNTSPASQIRFEGPKFTNRDTLFISTKTKIIMDSKDTGSGLKETKYNLNKEGDTKYSGPFQIEKQAFHILDFFASDNVNNTEQLKTQKLYIDNTPPAIHSHFSVEHIGEKVVRDEKFMIYPSNTKLYIAATDNLSGGEKLEYRINGAEKRNIIPIENFKPGNYEVEIFASDVLGNQSNRTIKFAIEK